MLTSLFFSTSSFSSSSFFLPLNLPLLAAGIYCATFSIIYYITTIHQLHLPMPSTQPSPTDDFNLIGSDLLYSHSYQNTQYTQSPLCHVSLRLTYILRLFRILGPFNGQATTCLPINPRLRKPVTPFYLNLNHESFTNIATSMQYIQ